MPTLCPACKGSRGVQPHKYYNTLKPGKKSSHSYARLFSKTFRVLLALSKVPGSCAWPWKVWEALRRSGRPGKFCREGPGRPWEALCSSLQGLGVKKVGFAPFYSSISPKRVGMTPCYIRRSRSVSCARRQRFRRRTSLIVQSEALAREKHISYEFKHVGQLPLTFSEPWRMTEVLLLRVSRVLRI